jgi:hypothetical protein
VFAQRGLDDIKQMRAMKRLGIAGQMNGSPRDVTADLPGEEKFPGKAICFCKPSLQSRSLLTLRNCKAERGD